MLTLDETVDVGKSPGAVFDYLADFTNITGWDPSVLMARQASPGLPQVGTRYRLKLLFGFRSVAMDYRIVAMEAPHLLVLEGAGGSFHAEDRITLSPHEGGTRIHYRVAITFHSPRARPFEAVLAPLIRRSGRRAICKLRDQLSNGGPVPRLTLTTRLVDQAILPGMIGFTRLGYRWGKNRWPLAPHALKGRRVVLTGGTSGIGRAAAFQLVALGADLVLVGRNREKTEGAAQRLRVHGGGKVRVEIADLSLMAEVRALAGRIAARFPAVDVLINNAGALFNRRQSTAEGIEKTLATDLLSPFLLTRQLLPVLAAGPASRIINVSSGGMYTRGIDLDNLDSARGPFNGAEAYARAKRALVMLTEFWAAELAPKNIRVHAMHPGWVDTPGLAGALAGFHERMRPWLRTPQEGADTITWLAAAAEAGRTTGLFWRDRLPRVTHVFPGTKVPPAAYPELVRRLKAFI